MKFLILSCGTGEGHNSAAKAIANYLIGKGETAEVRDVLSFKSERSRKRVTGAYGTIIRKTPWLFGLVYRLGAVYDRLKLPSPIFRYNAGYADRIYWYVKEHAFDAVICTHLFSMEAMTAIRKKYAEKIPSYGVLTDYTEVPFYKDTQLDGYFVPTDEVRGQLMKRGIGAEKIHVTGIPVDKKFGQRTERARAREIIEIPPEKKVIVVMTGGAGCGKIATLCKKLDKLTDGRHAIFLFTGNNTKLKQKLEARYGGEKFRILPFTPYMHLYLKAADVVLSKAGGLSLTEAAVCRVPLVITKSIPGVESANVKYFIGNGLALYSAFAKGSAKSAMELLKNGQLAESVRRAQAEAVDSEAVSRLAEIILKEIKNDDPVLERGDRGRVSVR